MSLSDLQRTWDELASKDAMWAVLTGPVGSQRAWNAEEFFRTGVEEIQFILNRVAAAGLTVQERRALDFGCGVGRLTQALAARFEQADGVDISNAMVERARALNRAGARARYHVNSGDDLKLFADASFDFVYSSITLQHIPPQYSRRYIGEFFRVAAPGGIVVFQIPSEPTRATRPRTRLLEALPLDGYRAVIAAPSDLACRAGDEITVPVIVRNISARPWPALGREDEMLSIRLGNHWRSGWLRRMLQPDDRRAELPHDLAPGESVEVPFVCRAPAKPGRYVLELDMVQEGVRWFESAGSAPAAVRVQVAAAVPAVGAPAGGQPAHMDMHGIPRSEIEAIIAASGGVLVAVDATDSAGAGWTSFRYIARRA